MVHAVQVGDDAVPNAKKLTTWLAAVVKGKVTFRDFRMAIERRIYLREQQNYNFYIKNINS